MTAEIVPAHTDGGAYAPMLSAAARSAVEAGMPDSTRRAYRESLARYLQWCAASGRLGLPCDGNALTEYATHLAYSRHRSPTYIERTRWAIIKWHKLAGKEAPGTEGFVDVLKGYRAHLAKTKDPLAKTRKATALSPDAIRAMFAKIDCTAPAGCRDVAMLAVGFVTAARIGELAALDIGDIEFADGHGLIVSIYRSKTRKIQELRIKYAQNPDLCPVRAARAWISMLASRGHTSGPLFLRIDKHGHVAPCENYAGPSLGPPDGRITPDAIADVVGRKALAAALGGRWTGHSIRRGFVTAAYGAGADPIDIADGGGWERGSRVMLGYIEEARGWDKHPLDGVL